MFAFLELVRGVTAFLVAPVLLYLATTVSKMVSHWAGNPAMMLTISHAPVMATTEMTTAGREA